MVSGLLESSSSCDSCWLYGVTVCSILMGRLARIYAAVTIRAAQMIIARRRFWLSLFCFFIFCFSNLWSYCWSSTMDSNDEIVNSGAVLLEFIFNCLHVSTEKGKYSLCVVVTT